MEIKKFTEYYYRSIRNIFLVLAGVGIGLNLLDISNFLHEERYIYYINITTVVLLLLVIGLHIGFKIPLATCFGLGIYIIVINILVSDYLAVRTEETEILMLFRESIFFILMLVFAGIFVQKYHTLVIFALMAYRYIITAISIKHPFLLDHLPIFLITFAALAAVVFFFAGVLHKSILEIQHKQKTIIDTNEELKVNAEELRATTEDLQHKNESLQDLNVSKDNIFSIISHDLKNPINSLSGFVELLVTKGDKLTKEKRYLYMTHIQAALQSMIHLLDSVLEWSRTQRNKVKVEPTTIKVTQITNSVFDFLGTQATDKNIRLINLAQPEHIVYADYNMVFTIIRNLISNAIKFSFTGKKTTLLSEKQDKHILITVIDEGVGIDEETQEKLNKMEMPTSTPGTNDEPGTGLGLLLCNEYIRKNGGKMHFASKEKEGSSFWFTLPIPTEQVKPES